MAVAVFTRDGWSWLAWSTIGTSILPCPFEEASPPKARDATVVTASSKSLKVGGGKPSSAEPARKAPFDQVGSTKL